MWEKCTIFWKTGPKHFHICANWEDTQKTVLQLNYVKTIVSLSRNWKESSSKSWQWLKISVIVIVISVIDLIFSESKKLFQKKPGSKEFHYFSERKRIDLSKPKLVSGSLSIFKKFQSSLSQKKTDSIQMPYIPENATNFFSKVKKAFRRKLFPRNSLIFQTEKGQTFQNQTNLRESLYC